MNYIVLINMATRQLRRSGVKYAQKESLTLLSYVIAQTIEYILAHPDVRVTKSQQLKYQSFVLRRSHHEPIEYITKQARFCGSVFYVNQKVLIPRPETEQLVDIAARIVKHNNVKSLVDLGTGSGAIAITLARLFPKLAVFASDRSSKAVRVAKRNIKSIIPYRHRLRLKTGKLLEPWRNTDIDLLIANLPYLTRDEIRNSPTHRELQFEPRMALYGGSDGLTLYRNMFRQLADRDQKPKWIIIEFGWRQYTKLKKLASQLVPGYRYEIVRDLGSQPRFLVITKQSQPNLTRNLN